MGFMQAVTFKLLIMENQQYIDLIDEDGHPSDQLNLSDIDPIHAASFESMIKDAFAEGKHFFVAKI